MTARLSSTNGLERFSTHTKTRSSDMPCPDCHSLTRQSLARFLTVEMEVSGRGRRGPKLGGEFLRGRAPAALLT